MRARFIIFHIFEPIKKRRKDTWAANKGESRQQETSKNSKPKRRRFLVLVDGDFGALHLSQQDSDHLDRITAVVGSNGHELTCGRKYWCWQFLRFFLRCKHSDCDDGVRPDVVANAQSPRAVSQR